MGDERPCETILDYFVDYFVLYFKMSLTIKSSRTEKNSNKTPLPEGFDGYI